MKAKISFLFVAALIATGTISHAQNELILPEDDYQQAVNMLSSNVTKLIDNSIRPQWTKDGRVWYNSETEGQSLYKLVDPKKKKVLTANTRSELFEKGKVGKVEEAVRRRYSRAAKSPDGKYEAFIKDWNLWIR